MAMIDFHSHTRLSYCADDDLTYEFYVDALKALNDVSHIAITDHGMAIYFPEDVAWSWRYITDSTVFDTYRDRGNEILNRHLGSLALHRQDGLLTGVEVEMMHDGRFTLDPAFRDRFEVFIGSVHYLPKSRQAGDAPADILRYWQKHTLQLLNSGIDILGHPFRWIANHCDVTRDVIREVVSEAVQAGVALELNSHYEIGTDVEMIRTIAEEGATLALGTDTHRADECGDFSYHLSVLAQAGIGLRELRILQLPGQNG